MRLIRAVLIAAAVMYSVALTTAVMASTAGQQSPQKPASSDSSSGGSTGKGWTIPEGAAKEPSPIPESPDVVAKGKNIYKDKCERCHGKEGKGDGKDADPDTPPDDLTDGSRAGRNPDGVMFYKIWNGRKSPKMPAFKSEGLSKEEVWTVIQYAKSLRKPA
jgi:mono/diheme cytochrome c family protein